MHLQRVMSSMRVIRAVRPVLFFNRPLRLKNMDSDSEEKNMSLERKEKNMNLDSKTTWRKDWENGSPAWHRNYVTPMLIKHHDEFTQRRQNLRVLVPMCGKSLDMVWLADQGHSVVGVEWLREGIECFFEENKLEYAIKPLKSSAGKECFSFNAKDKNITLIESDIFEFSRELYPEQFDGIWDRGGLTMVTMMEEARLKKYIEVMLSCLLPDGRYFKMSFRHVSQKNEGQWISHLSEEKLRQLVGDQCHVQLVGEDDVSTDPALLEAYSTASDHSLVYHFISFK